jgi:chloramphenicol 3-O phosphotransferase
MAQGTIILLNGASSSGKTSILHALQALLDPPFLDAGIDKFLWMLPSRYLDVPLWHTVFEYIWHPTGEAAPLEIRAGPMGHQLISGMHHAIAALAQAGNNVLVDHVLLEPGWVRECAQLLGDKKTLFVGVRCPLPLLEERERQRKDRTLGQARAQHMVVHAHGLYDLEVDTSLLSPTECAQQIRARLYAGSPPWALKQLQTQDMKTPPA